MYSNLDHITTLKQLVQVAVDDMRVVKANPKYRFDADIWHAPQSDGSCVVCVAGAVIANTLGCSITVEKVPGHFDRPTWRKLNLLDCIRGVYTPYIYSMLLDLEWPPLTLEQKDYLRENERDMNRGGQEAWEGFLEVLKK